MLQYMKALVHGAGAGSVFRVALSASVVSREKNAGRTAPVRGQFKIFMMSSDRGFLAGCQILDF